MRFSILASGSTGNALVVQGREATLLIDAGLSAKKIEQLLEEIGLHASELDAILITHEHSDHIKGVGVLARKYDLPVYANAKTWEELGKGIGDIGPQNRRIMETGESLYFETLRVESFPVSHDAADPVGYCFYEGEQKLSLATDLGYVSPLVKEKVFDSDVLILESNHDTEMLRMGHYPWNIKRRILSDTGHLSNEAAGEALGELFSEKLKRVYLAHLSRDYNMMDLAKMTVHNVLMELGIPVEKTGMKLMETWPNRPTFWDDLAEEYAAVSGKRR